MRFLNVLLHLGLLIGFSVAIKCFKCTNCSKYESSQSIACGGGYDRCLKVNLKSGEVDRLCATEEICQQRETQKEPQESVHCCSDNNCNKAASPSKTTWSSNILLLLVIVIRVLTSSL